MPNKNPKTVPLNIVGKSSDENIKRIEYEINNQKKLKS